MWVSLRTDYDMTDHELNTVCRDLAGNLDRFFELLQNIRKTAISEWLTVEEVAQELKVSRSIIYRLIRNGEIEAINIVDSGGKIAQKGHYRIHQLSLQQYLDSKKVKPLPEKTSRRRTVRNLPKVKNHLGL